MNKLWTDEGFEDYVYWQNEDRKTLKRINNLIKDIERNGAMQGIGKPERLKYRSGYSRRIDEKNRLLYDIRDGILYIISCRDHYKE